MPEIKYDDLEMAYSYASSGYMIDSQAYICRETGQVFYTSDDDWDDIQVPENLDDGTLYAQVPDQADFNLGKRLVFEFTDRQLPDEYESVKRIFRRSGAYGRFKEFLYRRGKLDEWYTFENTAIENALVKWATQEGFTVADK